MKGRAPVEGEAAAVWVPTDSLKKWERNPRRNAHVVQRVAELIELFGFGAPIVARRADSEVMAGHTRLEAAIFLHMPTVPVRFMDLDPADAHLYALADNKLAELASWDSELAGMLAALDAADAEVLGWTADELEELRREAGVGLLATGNAEALAVGLTIKFRTRILPMSPTDADRIAHAINRWKAEHGDSLEGFAASMLDRYVA